MLLSEKKELILKNWSVRKTKVVCRKLLILLGHGSKLPIIFCEFNLKLKLYNVVESILISWCSDRKHLFWKRWSLNVSYFSHKAYLRKSCIKLYQLIRVSMSTSWNSTKTDKNVHTYKTGPEVVHLRLILGNNAQMCIVSKSEWSTSTRYSFDKFEKGFFLKKVQKRGMKWRK